MPYSPCLLNAQVKTVCFFFTSYNYAFYLLSFFITSNFYSQFRLTQTYGLNVFLFFAIFLFSFFFLGNLFLLPYTLFYMSKCTKNLPKISLRTVFWIFVLILSLGGVSRDSLLLLVFPFLSSESCFFVSFCEWNDN